MNDSNRFWTIAGLAVLGILVGIGPFQRGHALLDSCSSYDDIEYAVDNNYEESTGGDISFRGKACKYTMGCSCSGFSPITDGDEWQKSWCENCNHPKSSHK